MTGEEGGEGLPQGYGHAQGRARVQGQGTAPEGHVQEAVTAAASTMTGGGDHHSPKGYYWLSP